MPRYFFDIECGAYQIYDGEGREFSGPSEAGNAGLILSSKILHPAASEEISVSVRDEQGRRVSRTTVCHSRLTARSRPSPAR
jgi:hypothetical protein